MKKFLIILTVLFLPTALQSAEIICPDNAPVGSPVVISISPIDKTKTAFLLKKEGFDNSDSFLELFDANGNPVTIFWSMVAGPRRMTLITASCLHEAATNTYGLATGPPEITYDVHILNYGGSVPPPPPPPDEPDAVFKGRVEPLISYLNGVGVEAADRKKLATFYKNFANTVAAGNSIADTAKFREKYIEAGKAAFDAEGIKGKYSGLAEIVDKVLVDTLGLDNVAFTASVRTEAVKALKAVAWAFSVGVADGKEPIKNNTPKQK